MDPASDGPSAELLSIGSELLAGETIDTNAAFLGSSLARLGIPLRGIRTLPDDRAAIAVAFSEARARVPLVVATGGLGPTHDDLTREGLADALGESLVPDPALEAHLRERFAAFGTMPESNLRQALRVPSAEALPNPIGSAPGWWVDRDGCGRGADAGRPVGDATDVGRAGRPAARRAASRCGRSTRGR